MGDLGVRPQNKKSLKEIKWRKKESMFYNLKATL